MNLYLPVPYQFFRKHGIITPVCTSNVEQFNNHHPITIIPVISKMPEKMLQINYKYPASNLNELIRNV